MEPSFATTLIPLICGSLFLIIVPLMAVYCIKQQKELNKDK